MTGIWLMITGSAHLAGYWDPMQIRVHYFAVLREQRGVSSEVLEIEEGTTMSDLYAQLFGATELAELPVLFALDESYVDREARIHDQAEVCFLPPLGGG